MKITIGPSPQTDFHIYDDDGKEITKHLRVKSFSCSVGHDTGLTLVHMSCYAEGVEILGAQASVKIVEDEKQ